MNPIIKKSRNKKPALIFNIYENEFQLQRDKCDTKDKSNLNGLFTPFKAKYKNVTVRDKTKDKCDKTIFLLLFLHRSSPALHNRRQ